MALFHDPLWLVPFSVFLGGLVGSPHCLSMCGPIVLNFANQKSRLLAYQIGRMLAYSTAGAVVGAFGKAVLGEDRPEWLSSLSLLLIAVLLIINGYRAIAGKPLHPPLPQFVNQAFMRLWKNLRVSSLPHTVTAGIAGVFTVFLPCGHLYSFLIGAVTTGSTIRGAVFMFAFWLGSTPLLSFGGAWLQKILKPRIAGGQRWAGVLLVVAGLFSVLAFGARTEAFNRMYSASVKNQLESEKPLICH